MKDSELIFDYVYLFHYKCHKINPNCDGSYIDFSEWIKKKATKNYITKKDNKCCQYTLTVALNHEEIKKDPQRIKKMIKLFITKYNWDGINVPSEKDDWTNLKKIM